MKYVEWSWEASDNPEIQSGIITIKHEELSVSFKMERFETACKLINIIEAIKDTDRSECINEISLAMISTINDMRKKL